MIFDFDETLARVSFKKEGLAIYDEQFDILTPEKTISCFINFRPYLFEALRILKTKFELILFTSSTKTYCQALIANYIEDKEMFFDHKLYKNDCVLNPYNGKGVLKNLDKLLTNRKISDIVIVDDLADNFINH